MNFDDVRARVERYYSERLAEHGATSRGVDWNSRESQFLRFDQLVKIVDVGPDEEFSLLDYGCGYGALWEVVEARWPRARYVGFDVAPEMLNEARRQYPKAEFVADAQPHRSDYCIGSGLFSVKLDTTVDRWEAYVRETLVAMAALSERGFAVNMLTAYSDIDKMRGDLYYADPHAWFDFCRKNISRRVALLHDYPLYEFSLIVRK